MSKRLKHTHRGFCQVCGRLQAAQPHCPPPHHNVAKHGYKVKDFGYRGQFVGTCEGSDLRPLQEERERCDQLCKSLEQHAADQYALAERYKTGKAHPDSCETTRMERDPDTRRMRPVRVAWVDATEYQRRDELERRTWMHNSNAKMAQGHAAMLRALADRVHGQPLEPK